VKKIKISIVGALGRMGRILCKKIKNNPKLILQSITDKNTSEVEGLQTEKNSINAFKNSSVIIDFSNPESTMQVLKNLKLNSKIIIGTTGFTNPESTMQVLKNLKLNSKIIIGTTGFTEKQEKKIKNYSKKYAILKSGNMSVGINLLSFITEQLSKKISNNFQISIHDNHHKKKIDYPSGTALMLANAVAYGKDKKFKNIKGNIHLNKKGKNLKNKINFNVIRYGKTIGKHSVQFEDFSEIIRLKHIAKNRDLFANGAINAAFWIRNKKRGYYSMRDLLKI